MAQLSEDQFSIMRVLWEGGEMKPSEIRQRLPFAIKDSALRYHLSVLRKAGYLNRRKRGKAYHYRAARSPDGTLRGILRSLADAFNESSTAGLLIRMVRQERLSAEEIEELKRLAAESAQDGKQGKP